ncbi:phosphatase 2C-like domain-containing protein [Lipomyces kononenkoae]|uniref:Phosphatase 2C-like domain-containing protein n=1 Tax=Lipomyces kononenkoae TaxID=34357 RepID=A0ACC3ST92_LIPKO
MPPASSAASAELPPGMTNSDHRRKKSTSSTASSSTKDGDTSSGNSPTSFFARFTGTGSGSNKEPDRSFKVLRTKSTSPSRARGVLLTPPTGFNGTFTVGVSEDENLKCRNTMEDTHTVIYDFGAAGSGESSPVVNPSTHLGGPFAALAKSIHASSASASSSTLNSDATSVTSTTFGNNRGHNSNDAGYFAIFDGHAGKAVADWCGQKLHLLLEEQLRKDPHGPVPEIFDRTFTEADIQLSKQSLKNAGCTAAVALLRWEEISTTSYSSTTPNGHSPGTDSQRNKASEAPPSEISPHHLYRHYHFLHHHRSKVNERDQASNTQRTVRERMLYTANAGDARIVLCRKGKALRLSYDHKGTDQMEAQRIKNSGGVVLNGRVNGILAVTRALGDSYIKKLVISHPYTTETYLTPDDEFAILACDGLWDVCSDQEAVDIIRDVKDSQQASRILIDYALAHFSMDNLTCMVVRFEDKMAELIRKNHSAPDVDAFGSFAANNNDDTDMASRAAEKVEGLSVT